MNNMPPSAWRLRPLLRTPERRLRRVEARRGPHHPASGHLGNPRREPFPSGCLAVLATRTVEDVAIIAGVCLVLLTLELLCMLVIAIKG